MTKELAHVEKTTKASRRTCYHISAHGQRSLAGSMESQESDTIEQINNKLFLFKLGKLSLLSYRIISLELTVLLC